MVILKEYDWETHALVAVEVEDGPIEEFLNFLFTTRRWQEDPDLVYRKYVKLKETLFGAEARRRRALRRAEAEVERYAVEEVDHATGSITLTPMIEGEGEPREVPPPKRGPGRPKKVKD